MFRVIVTKFVIFLVCQFFVESRADLLSLFKPQRDLPQPLNDFLIDVQLHKKDFAFIRNVAKNRRKYEKSYAENHNLFAEDLDNQLTLSPYYSKRLDSLDNRNPRPNVYDQIARSPEVHQGNNVRSYYPNNRYSKFIHSPIRLQRELEANYLDAHVKLKPNGLFGEIKRPEPKLPGNRFNNDENKYRVDYSDMVEVEDKDNGDDYPEIKPSNKKKREVEISIKSDGKLVKRIEEDEDGPKSIVLNIKALNADEKSQILGNPKSHAIQSGATTDAAGQSPQNNKNPDNGPSNSKTIPSLSNSNQNQNGDHDKNFGVPINSIPASNNAYSNNKNEASSLNQNDDSDNDLNAKNAKESINQDKSAVMQKYHLPEVSKVSNSENDKQKIDSYNSKSFGENFDNSRWSADGNQMAKSIDIAQNNVNKFSGNKEKPNMNEDSEELKKESEFEKIQGLVVDDSTDVSDNIKENANINYVNKRESIKEKRWDETMKGMDESNLPLDIQDIQANGAANGAFDYALPLQKEANDLNNPDSGQELPDSIHWNTGDHEIQLNPNEKYEVIEQSTKNVLILPIVDPTTPCVIDVHVPNDDNLNDEAKVEQAKIIGNAIAQEIKKDEKAEAEAEAEKKKEECVSDRPFPNHEEGKEEDEKEGEIEIIRQEEGKEDKHCPHGSNKEPSEKRKDLDRIRHNPREYHHEGQIMNHNNGRKQKRQIVKKKKSRKYVVKQNSGKKERHFSELNNPGPEKAKPEQEEASGWSDNALRNKKHMPPVPKYKKKRVRQHPKKRVDRVNEEPSLVDYYNFNELYDSPGDTFDFIPSFYKRQLQSLNYEYDPNVIHDFGDHDEEEIRKFEKAEDDKEKLKKLKSEETDEKFQGHRKKFKSEGEYSDEEESNKSISKKVPRKKTKNQFAPATETTTEDNDDDYNYYEDLSDMQDEEEDVAYEEEKSDDIDVDEAVGNNSQSYDENDRLDLKQLMASYLAFPRIIPHPSLKGHTRKYLIIKAVPYLNDKKFLGEVHQNVYEEGHEKVSVARGHGSSNKKRKKKKKKQKKKPKRDDESIGDRILKMEDQDLAGDISSFHGRGNRGFKFIKHKQPKPKREDVEPISQKGIDLTKGKMSDQFEEKPLSSQEKQDIFLRYNPDFQRWPRFVQSDNVYKEIMKKRALDHQKRYFRNAHNMNMFPISNGYFLNPEKPVKREEPATEGTETTAASNAASETESNTASEAAANAASEAASSEAGEATESSTTESFAEQKEQASETTPNMETEGSHVPDSGVNGATLPQAAKNILQTANSDIFENTTAPSMEEAGNGTVSAGAASNADQTQFRFTTTAEDLTENTLCMTPHKDITAPCPDESASHSPVTVTSILPIVPEAVTLLKFNITKAEYLDLNDIVDGALPRHIVSNSLSSAKGNIRQGLNTGKFNMNVNVSNYNSNAETRLILNAMTNLMLKLKYHTTCQALPANLKTYVKIITKNEMDSPMSKIKEMEEIDFDEHQSSYVFHGSEGDSIQNKAQALKDLLNKYNTLPDNCKERAEPVREYIESHLAMIDNVNGNNKGKAKQTAGAAKPDETSSTVHPKKEKKEISLSNSENTEEKDLNGQMMEEGLNNQHADANEAIEDKDKKSKREAEDVKFPPVFRGELSTSTSPQYGKLAEAVRKLRHRRESEKRIGEIYGRAKREDEEKVENEEQSKKDKGFESPLVINF